MLQYIFFRTIQINYSDNMKDKTISEIHKVIDDIVLTAEYLHERASELDKSEHEQFLSDLKLQLNNLESLL